MEMGQRVAVHRGTFGSGGWMWYVGGLLLVAGGMGLGKAALHADSSQLGTGVAGLVIGTLLLIVPLTRWRQQVEVFERGFVWTKLLGKVEATRDQIRDAKWIRHISKRGQHDEVEVTLVNGKCHSMTGLDHSEQLTNLLRATSPQPVPAAAAAGQAWTPGAWTPPGA